MIKMTQKHTPAPWIIEPLAQGRTLVADIIGTDVMIYVTNSPRTFVKEMVIDLKKKNVVRWQCELTPSSVEIAAPDMHKALHLIAGFMNVMVHCVDFKDLTEEQFNNYKKDCAEYSDVITKALTKSTGEV